MDITKGKRAINAYDPAKQHCANGRREGNVKNRIAPPGWRDRTVQSERLGPARRVFFSRPREVSGLIPPLQLSPLTGTASQVALSLCYYKES